MNQSSAKPPPNSQPRKGRESPPCEGERQMPVSLTPLPGGAGILTIGRENQSAP